MKYTPEFKRTYSKLDKSLREKVKTAINKLMSGQSGKRLKYNLKEYYSIRVSNIRVIYKVDGNDIILIACGHRKNVYR